MIYSVVIPTFNNRALKRGALDAVLTSIRSSADLIREVIIVDNASTEVSFVPSADYPFKIITTSCPYANNRSATRNAGAALATGSHVVFLDDDTIAPESILLELETELSNQSFWSCASRRFLGLDIPILDVIEALEGGQRQKLMEASHCYPGTDEPRGRWSDSLRYTYAGSFSVVPLTALRAIGGFAEEFTGWGLEDTDFMCRLMEHLELKSLFKRCTVLHCDHYVSPYQMVEESANREKFRNRATQLGYSFHGPTFTRAILGGEYGGSTSSQTSRSGTVSTAHSRNELPKDVGRELDRIAEEHLTEGILLSRASIAQKRFEIFILVGSGDRITTVKEFAEGSNTLVSHVVPLSRLPRWLHLEAFDSDSWLIELGKWAHGEILFDFAGLMAHARAQVAAWTPERIATGLMQVVGDLGELLSADQTRTSVAYITHRSLCFLRYIKNLEFPKSKFEFFDAVTEWPNKSREEVLAQALEEIALFRKSPAPLTRLPAYHATHLRGAKILAAHLPLWLLPVESRSL